MNLNEQISRIKEMMGLVNEQLTTTGYNLPQGHVEPTCTDDGCKGTYSGPQFLKSDSSDVAHKYSNTMSYYVGVKLKELYKQGIYVKVDLKNITMTAVPVQYGENYNPTKVTIDIPFIRVKNKCDAYTSFDHVGGWGHLNINLNKRKTNLSSLLLPGETLDVSDLKTTDKNVSTSLNEYWIQWKNKVTQSDCSNISTNVTPQTTSVTPQKTNVTPQTTSVTPQTTSSSSNDMDVVVQARSFLPLREELIKKSSGSTIDTNSIVVDMDNFKVTYKLGQTKINKITLFTRNNSEVSMSEDDFNTELNNVITRNKVDGITIKIIKQGKQNVLMTNEKIATQYWAVLLLL